MFDDLRQVQITGGITQDVSLAFTNNGTALLKLNVGSTESKKVNDEYQNVSHYYEVVVWGRYAEMLSNKLSKGDKVLITGRLDFQSWEKDGQKRSKLVINASGVKPLSQSNNQSNGDKNQSNNQQNNYQNNNIGNNQHNFDGRPKDSSPYNYPSNNNGGFENNIPH